MHIILWCMGSKFCVKFQRCPLKFHAKFWTHTPQNVHFIDFYFRESFKISLDCDVISLSETGPWCICNLFEGERHVDFICQSKIFIWATVNWQVWKDSRIVVTWWNAQLGLDFTRLAIKWPILNTACNELIILTFGKVSSTKLSIAASPYCLYADAFSRIRSASALPTASMAAASEEPISLIRSASARAPMTVWVLNIAQIHYILLLIIDMQISIENL